MALSSGFVVARDEREATSVESFDSRVVDRRRHSASVQSGTPIVSHSYMLQPQVQLRVQRLSKELVVYLVQQRPGGGQIGWDWHSPSRPTRKVWLGYPVARGFPIRLQFETEVSIEM